MPEDTPTCRIYEKSPLFIYPAIKCENAVLAGDPHWLCILHSHLKEKDPDAFREALVARWNQKGQKFCDFRMVFFPGPFDALEIFGSLEFKKPIDFSLARFTMRANFSEASFTRGADFFRTRFLGEADFGSATIGGRVIFRSINPPEEDSPAPQFIADFSNLQFQENGVLCFQDMSLAQVKFAGTDLRRPEFHHVAWDDSRGRQKLYDEVLLRIRQTQSFFLKHKFFFPPPTKDEYGEVERLYRNLQVNYESANDYKSSGDFHYGELEMHRRASPWRWFPLYWYNLYWLSSGYGERPLRAVLTLAGLLLVFSLVLLGLENILDVPGNWTLAGFWQALLYVFQQGTLQKPDWLELDSTGGKFLSALMPVFIPGQTALFLLALRNRLGRRR